MSMQTPVPANAVVPVASAWYSKINWTQAVSFGSTLLTLGFGAGYSIPAETQLAIVATIQGVTNVATWALKTFFTGTVTPSSL